MFFLLGKAEIGIDHKFIILANCEACMQFQNDYLIS